MEIANFNYIDHSVPKIILENHLELENLNFLIIPNEDIDFQLEIILSENENKNIQIGIYNYSHFQINCNVSIKYQKQFNNCDVNVIVLGSDQSQTNVTIKATIETENNKIVQNIKGFLLSKQAKISGLPLLDIKTNQVIANHGLAIGCLNKEQMFYLMTKGFNENQVKQILLLSQFENLLSNCSDEVKQEYLHKINQLWSNQYDKY